MDLATRQVSAIPFSANVEVGMGQHLFVPTRASDAPVQVTQLVTVAESPDARRIAFSAVGKVYIATRDGLAFSAPRRMTNATGREYYPSFSPDGRRIAFVRGASAEFNLDIWLTDLEGHEPRQITTGQWLHCEGVVWRPNGQEVLFTAGDLFVRRAYAVLRPANGGVR